jgi:RHS repeat-associated protein
MDVAAARRPMWQDTTQGGQMMDRRGIARLFCALCMLVGGAAYGQQQGTVTYVYTDPQGTPLAEADANGNITATYDYTPYGTVVLGTPPSGPGYTGHVNDPETSLVYMQARYYDPATGRFLSVDPLSPTAGNAFSLNRYSYGNNNPIIHSDPTGKSVTCDQNSCTIDAHSLLEVAIDYTYVGGVYLQHAIQNTMAQAPSKPATQTQPGAQKSTPTTPSDSTVDGSKESQRPTKTPNEGEPGSTYKNPGSGQEREYGPDGKPSKDIDYDHDHGQGTPHVHEWGRDSNGNPVRGTGRAPNPQTEPHIAPPNTSPPNSPPPSSNP